MPSSRYLSRQETAIAIARYADEKSKKNKKQVQAINIICSRPSSFVPLPQRLLRDVPFVCSSRASTIRILTDGTIVEIVKCAAGAPDDRDMLLVVSIFFEAFKGLSKADLTKVAEGGALAEVKIPLSQLRWWHQGRTVNLKRAAARLSAYTVLYTDTEGDVDSHRYFSEFKIKENVLIALIDRDTAIRTLKCCWDIDIDKFLGLKTGCGRAIFLLTAADKRPVYDLIKMAKRLGLPVSTAAELRDTLSDLHRGFADLEGSKMLTRRNTKKDDRHVMKVAWKTAQSSADPWYCWTDPLFI